MRLRVPGYSDLQRLIFCGNSFFQSVQFRVAVAFPPATLSLLPYLIQRLRGLPPGGLFELRSAGSTGPMIVRAYGTAAHADDEQE